MNGNEKDQLRFAIFAKPITPKILIDLIGNPLSSTEPDEENDDERK